jgi:hypothetical protein
MRTNRKLSLGGKIALSHFACLAVFLLIPEIIGPTPTEKSYNLRFCLVMLYGCGVPLLTLPISLFIDLELWMTETRFVALCFIFAANSFAVGYGYAYALSFLRKRRAKATA